MSRESQQASISQLSSAEDFPAKILVQPENKTVLSKEQDHLYSENLSELLMILNPNGCLLKMYPSCVTLGCPLSSVTLPPSGMMQNGTLSQPQQQVHLIEGKERLLYPTPVTVDCKGESKGCSRHLHTDMVRRICLQAFYQKVGKETVYPHPEFVEQLMGFPTKWTELDASETPLSHNKSIRSSKQLQTLKMGEKCKP